MIRTSPFHERTIGAQRDRPVEPLVRAPGRREVPDCRTSSSTSRSATPPASSTRRRCSSTGSPAPTRSAFLAGVLARDIRDVRAGPRAVHDLVRRPRLRRRGRRHPPARRGRVPPDRRRAEPRLLRRTSSAGATRSRSRRSATTRRARRPGPALARPARGPRPGASRRSPFFELATGEDRRRAGHHLADRLHRRPRLRGLGRGRRRAHGLGRGVGGGRGHGVLPFGLQALYMTRIEAGPAAARRRLRHRAASPGPTTTASTPARARPRLDAPRHRRPTIAPFIGRDAIRRELADEDVALAD